MALSRGKSHETTAYKMGASWPQSILQRTNKKFIRFLLWVMLQLKVNLTSLSTVIRRKPIFFVLKTLVHLLRISRYFQVENAKTKMEHIGKTMSSNTQDITHLSKKIIVTREINHWGTPETFSSEVQLIFNQNATSGNRTRVSRVAGENSTTEPTLLEGHRLKVNTSIISIWLIKMLKG